MTVYLNREPDNSMENAAIDRFVIIVVAVSDIAGYIAAHERIQNSCSAR